MLVLDHPSRVAGREVDVRDHVVPRIGRVDFAKRTQPQFLVGPDLAERYALEGRRLDARYHDSGDVCLG